MRGTPGHVAGGTSVVADAAQVRRPAFAAATPSRRHTPLDTVRTPLVGGVTANGHMAGQVPMADEVQEKVVPVVGVVTTVRLPPATGTPPRLVGRQTVVQGPRLPSARLAGVGRPYSRPTGDAGVNGLGPTLARLVPSGTPRPSRLVGRVVVTPALPAGLGRGRRAAVDGVVARVAVPAPTDTVTGGRPAAAGVGTPPDTRRPVGTVAVLALGETPPSTRTTWRPPSYYVP